VVSFIPVIPSTSVRLHSEFIRLLFLQTHRETDRFFAASGFQLAQTHRGQFHFRLSDFTQQVKSKVDLTLAKAADLRINLNLDGEPIACVNLLVCSLPSHRHSYIGFIFSSRFIDS
jgi:hypothetical protein